MTIETDNFLCAGCGKEFPVDEEHECAGCGGCFCDACWETHVVSNCGEDENERA